MSYDARETDAYAGAPVELYRFTCAANTWTYTSADVAQSYLGVTYKPQAITRGEIDASDEDSQGSLEVTLPLTLPVALLFIADLPPAPVTLELFRMHRGDTEVVSLWSGEISKCDFAGSVARLTGQPVSRALRQQLPPNSFQAQCNWTLFSPQCGLDRNTYRVAATVTAVSGFDVTATEFASHADGYFTAGWLEDAAGEKHWIVAHVGDTVTLMTPFRSLAASDAVSAYPGCDRTIAACKVYGNLQRFLGFPYLPTKNPFVVGVS